MYVDISVRVDGHGVNLSAYSRQIVYRFLDEVEAELEVILSLEQGEAEYLARIVELERCFDILHHWAKDALVKIRMASQAAKEEDCV